MWKRQFILHVKCSPVMQTNLKYKRKNSMFNSLHLRGNHYVPDNNFPSIISSIGFLSISSFLPNFCLFPYVMKTLKPSPDASTPLTKLSFTRRKKVYVKWFSDNAMLVQNKF